MLDGQIGDAAARIEPVGRGESRGRADIEAGAAIAAMVGLASVGGQLQRGVDLAEKEPGAVRRG
jgi:hypothetical protein